MLSFLNNLKAEYKQFLGSILHVHAENKHDPSSLIMFMKPATHHLRVLQAPEKKHVFIKDSDGTVSGMQRYGPRNS